MEGSPNAQKKSQKKRSKKSAQKLTAGNSFNWPLHKFVVEETTLFQIGLLNRHENRS